MPLEEKELQEVKEKVRELEKKSHIELVPVVAVVSSEYRYFRITFGLVIAFFTMLVTQPFFEAYVSVGISVATVLVMQFLLQIESVFRFVVPRGLQQREVMNAAHRAFLAEEVFKTQYRSGILIYVSHVEHMVYVLADKGFDEVASDNDWAQLGQQLAKFMAKSDKLDTFLEALESISSRFAEHFKVGGENSNELPDHVRVYH